MKKFLAIIKGGPAVNSESEPLPTRTLANLDAPLSSAQADARIQKLHDEVKKRLRETTKGPEDDHDKQFLTLSGIRGVWTESSNDNTFLDRLSQLLDLNEIRKKHVADSCLKILSTFVLVGFPSWAKDFERVILNANSLHSNRPRIDEELPFSQKDLESDSFLPGYGEHFFRTQSLVCPITIEPSLGRLICPKDARLPCERIKDIEGTGRVTFGDVSAECVRGIKSASQQAQTIRLAFKHFKPDRRADFMIEEDNLQTVHKRLKAWPQPHVASFISSIQIGKDDEEAHRYLVFKAADANLGEILFGKVNLLSQQKTAPAAPTPFVVMKELRGLAKGLSWLHSALDDKEHKVPRICHFDIKPSNILVWWRDGERYWRLKYADFGISSTGYHEEFPQDIESTRTLRTRVRQERAEYQPPEVEENIPVGRSVDVWSYGCLLFEILGFTIEGPTQAKKFQVIRRERYKTRTFYYKDNGESKLIPEIASFLTAWKKKVSWILGWAELVEDILKIDPSERPKAKDLEWRTDKLMDQLERRIDCGKPLPWTLASDASHEANHHQSAAQAPSNARSLPARSSPHTQNLSWNVDSLHVDTQPPIPKLKHPAKRARWTPGADKVVLQKESHVCFLDPGTSVITPIELGNVSLIRAFAVGGKYAAILYEAGESQQVRVLDAAHGFVHDVFKHGEDVSVSTLGDCLIHLKDDNMLLIDAKSQSETLITVAGTRIAASFSADGNQIFVWSKSNGTDRWSVIDRQDTKMSKELSGNFHAPRQQGQAKNLLIPFPAQANYGSVQPLFLAMDAHGFTTMLTTNDGASPLRGTLRSLPLDNQYGNIVHASMSPSGECVALLRHRQGAPSLQLLVLEIISPSLGTSKPLSYRFHEYKNTQGLLADFDWNASDLIIVKKDLDIVAHVVRCKKDHKKLEIRQATIASSQT